MKSVPGYSKLLKTRILRFQGKDREMLNEESEGTFHREPCIKHEI